MTRFPINAYRLDAMTCMHLHALPHPHPDAPHSCSCINKSFPRRAHRVRFASMAVSRDGLVWHGIACECVRPHHIPSSGAVSSSSQESSSSDTGRNRSGTLGRTGLVGGDTGGVPGVVDVRGAGPAPRVLARGAEPSSRSLACFWRHLVFRKGYPCSRSTMSNVGAAVGSLGASARL